MTLYHLTDDESGALLGTSFTASREGVDWVMSQPIGDDGRSEFMWLRLSNGDLVLGVYPRGDSGYFGCEATVEADYAAATMGRSHPEWPANEGVELGCDDPHCGVCYRLEAGERTAPPTSQGESA